MVYIHSGVLFIRKKKILLFVTTWMDLESIMLGERSQRKTKSHLYVESKKQNS